MAIEVKFRVPDPGIFWLIQTIEQLGPYSLSVPQFEQINDAFLDTQKRRLKTAGYYCRQREQAKGCLITLFERESKDGEDQLGRKWDVSLKRNTDNPEDWPESQARKRILQVIPNKKLKPIFRLHKTRITRLIQEGDQIVARATLDDVSLLLKDENQQFKTLKITMLIPDNENHLHTITASLQARWQLETEPQTKFEQAIALDLSER